MMCLDRDSAVYKTGIILIRVCAQGASLSPLILDKVAGTAGRLKLAPCTLTHPGN